MPKGSTSFAYPNPHELAPWIAAEMGSGPSASAADAAAKRISTAGRMFTYSALTVPIAGALAGFGLSRIPTRMPEATYWTIALTLAVLVLFTTASWRSLVGLRWPSVATLYYGAACINRLRVGGNEQHDLRYLTIVLPLLERQLSSPHLASEVAGTKVARLHVAGIQAKLVADIGEAERHWRGERGTAGRDGLRGAIGRAVAIVVLDGWFVCKTKPSTVQTTPVPGSHESSVFARVWDSIASKGTDAALGAVGSGALLILASRPPIGS